MPSICRLKIEGDTFSTKSTLVERVVVCATLHHRVGNSLSVVREPLSECHLTFNRPVCLAFVYFTNAAITAMTRIPLATWFNIVSGQKMTQKERTGA